MPEHRDKVEAIRAWLLRIREFCASSIRMMPEHDAAWWPLDLRLNMRRIESCLRDMEGFAYDALQALQPEQPVGQEKVLHAR